MKHIKLFEEFSIDEKKITVSWDDDDHAFVFSDEGPRMVDYDGSFLYRGEWFDTHDHNSEKDLIRDLEKTFKGDKFTWVNK